MPICTLNLERNWIAEEVEHILPGRPRSWYLRKLGYPDFKFPTTENYENSYPGTETCNAITQYIEKYVPRKDSEALYKCPECRKIFLIREIGEHQSAGEDWFNCPNCMTKLRGEVIAIAKPEE